MTFTQFANETLKNLPNTKTAYEYKQHVIAEMTKRANELISSGLKDNKVINEMIIEEFSDIENGFYKMQEQKKSKIERNKKGKLSVLGSICYVLVLVVAFLASSFITHAWKYTWLFLVAGLLVPLAVGMIYSTVKLAGKKTAYTILSRITLFGAIFILATVLFLFAIMLTDIKNTWLIFLFAVAGSLLSDGILASKAKQKTAILSWLLYIPAIASMLYVIVGITMSLWHPTWLIIIAGVVLDIVILMAKVVGKAEKAEQEMGKPWEKE